MDIHIFAFCPTNFFSNQLSLQLISKEIRRAEREYMNMHPPPPINALVRALSAVIKNSLSGDSAIHLSHNLPQKVKAYHRLHLVVMLKPLLFDLVHSCINNTRNNGESLWYVYLYRWISMYGFLKHYSDFLNQSRHT